MENYNITDKIAQLRKVIGEEKAAEVSPLLSEIQTRFISVESDNKANIGESMGRKDKIRTHEATISDQKAQIEKLSDDSAFIELKTENEKLKAFQTQVHGDTRKNLITRVESYKDNEKFAEVRDNLALATKTEKVEGKEVIVFDPESMDAAAVTHSLGKIMEYEGIGVLGKNGENQTVDSPGPDGIIKKTVVKTEDVDIVALAKSDSAAAAKILTSQGHGHKAFVPIITK